MKNKLRKYLIVILFIVGLLFMLYPTISNYWNDIKQSSVIAKNIEKVEELTEEDYTELLENARIYNEYIAKNNFLQMTKAQLARYKNVLKVSEDGMMGYIEIPKINVKLPIYHGTSDEVLQVAIGHMEGSSLPIGGKSTHTVLLGHRGLPSAQLFTSLDKMGEGDIFYLNFLKEKIAYEVDNVSVVEPEELDDLKIIEGEDYATLVTCTPYGVNTHRLLVRGKRTEISEDIDIKTTLNALDIIKILVIIFIVIIMIIILRHQLKKKKKNKKYNRKRKTHET